MGAQVVRRAAKRISLQCVLALAALVAGLFLACGPAASARPVASSPGGSLETARAAARLVVKIKAGLTGWAQVRYTYGASIEDAMEKLQYDLFYIKNMSAILDTFILFSTVKTVLRREGSR